MISGESSRTLLIKIVTFLGGIYFFLKFLLPREFTAPVIGVVKFGKYHEQIALGLTALVVVSVGLGLINIVVGHGTTILYRRRGWIYSGTLLLGLFLMLLLSTLQWVTTYTQSARANTFFELREFALRIKEDAEAPKPISVGTIPPVAIRNEALTTATKKALRTVAGVTELAPFIHKVEEATLVVEQQTRGATPLAGNEQLGIGLSELGAAVTALPQPPSIQQGLYRILFEGLFVALGSAMFSLLGFYIASAAYRAFRVRSLESALMMGAALVVILGQIPLAIFGEGGGFGEAVQRTFPAVRNWLLTVPNSAAFRAIELGSAIGGLVMAVRMWLSIESKSFTKEEK